MNTNKLLFLHILISLISQNISWDYVKGGLDWPESCQSNINYDQGPLDISPPFISLKKTMHPFFKNITYSFHYSKLNTDYLYYNDGNNLITEGDFGYITFNNENYFSNQLHIYSPSIHTIGNHRYPIEIQIINENNNGEIIIICFFMKESSTSFNLLLSKLGFDNPNNKNLQPFVYNKIKEQINLMNYVSDSNEFFIYESRSLVPDCDKKGLIMIASNILEANKIQIENFPVIIKNNNRILQYKNGRQIYLTFDYDDQALLNKKIEDNEKIVKENEDREKMESKFEGKVTLKSENNNKLDSSKIINKIPFEIVEAKALNKDKLNKKIEPKFIGKDEFDINEKVKNIIIIDKEMPTTILYDLYQKYLDSITKRKIKFINNQTSLIELSKVENEFNNIFKVLDTLNYTKSSDKSDLQEYNITEDKFKSKEIKDYVNKIEDIINQFELNQKDIKEEIENRSLENIFSIVDNLFNQLYENNKEITKISTYTLVSLMQFIIDLNDIPQLTDDEKYTMLYNFSNYLLNKQNGYYRYNQITKLDIYNKINKEIIKPLAESTSERIIGLNSTNLIPLYLNIFVICKVKLIKKSSEGFTDDKNKEKKDEIDIDYDAYQYSRIRKEKKSVKQDLINEQDETSFDICSNNTNEFQSPININSPFIQELYQLNVDLNFAMSNITMKNDGWKIYANGDFGYLNYKNKSYLISQIDFHTKSEHVFNNIHSAMEIQLISYDGAAIGIFFDYNNINKEHPLLNAFGFDSNNRNFASTLRNKNNLFIDDSIRINIILYQLNRILNKKNLLFVSYEGSLTSGNCQNGIKWFILSNKEVTSRIQVEYFKVLLGKDSNFRKTQKINGRVVSAM